MCVCVFQVRSKELIVSDSESPLSFTCESSREGHMQKIQLRIAKMRPYARSLCATFLDVAVTESFLFFLSVKKLELLHTLFYQNRLAQQSTSLSFDKLLVMRFSVSRLTVQILTNEIFPQKNFQLEDSSIFFVLVRS